MVLHFSYASINKDLVVATRQAICTCKPGKKIAVNYLEKDYLANSSAIIPIHKIHGYPETDTRQVRENIAIIFNLLVMRVLYRKMYLKVTITIGNSYW